MRATSRFTAWPARARRVARWRRRLIAAATALILAPIPSLHAAHPPHDPLATASADTEPASLGPAIQGLPLNSAVAHNGLVYMFTMDVSPSRIYVYDPEKRSLRREIRFPPGSGNRTWATEVVGDTLYIGQDGVGGNRENLFALDLSDAAGTPQPVAHVPPDGDFWDLTSCPEGFLYAATRVERTLFRIDPRRPRGERVSPIRFSDASFPRTRHEVTALLWDGGVLLAGLRGREQGGTARLLRINPDRVDDAGMAATTDLTRWGPGDDGRLQGQGVYHMAIDGDQWLLGLQGSGNQPATFVRFEREAGPVGEPSEPRPWNPVPSQVTPLPDESAVTSFARIDASNDFLVAGNTTGTVYLIGPEGMSAVAQPVPFAPIRALIGDSGRAIGVTSATIVWQLDSAAPDPGILLDDLIELGAPGDTPVRPHAIERVGDRLVAGGNNVLQTLHLDTGERERFAISGEAKAMTTDGNGVYIATYPKGQLWHYDPESGATEVLVDWPDIENRPWGITWDPERGHVIVTTQSDYRDYGSVYTIDPSQPREKRIVREQRAVTGTDAGSRHGRAVAVAGDRLLVGSNGNSPTLASIDLSTGEVTSLTSPAPGLGHIQAIVGEPDGTRAHLLTAGGWWLAVDPRDGTVTQRAHVLPDGNAGHLAMRDRTLHAVSADHLVLIEPRTGTSRTVARFPAAISHLNQRNAVRFDRDMRQCDVFVLTGSQLARIPCGPRMP